MAETANTEAVVAPEKPRFIRKFDGKVVYPWSAVLAKKPGFVECDAKGIPFSMGGGEASDAVVVELETKLAKSEQEIELLRTQLADQTKAFAEKEQILGDEYKKAKAEASELKKENTKLKKAAKNEG
ncbi:MAG: hypothetical protein JW713_05840 [Pontiellaceae bacterium]|nr:hypothetical protein [Pontiellaceae bacterium]